MSKRFRSTVVAIVFVVGLYALGWSAQQQREEYQELWETYAPVCAVLESEGRVVEHPEDNGVAVRLSQDGFSPSSERARSLSRFLFLALSQRSEEPTSRSLCGGPHFVPYEWVRFERPDGECLVYFNSGPDVINAAPCLAGL